MRRPFKPCPRTDCVAIRTKHAHLEFEVKGLKKELRAKEELVRLRIETQSESYEQRLQAAHSDIEAFNPIVKELEAKYLEEKKKNENLADFEARYLEEKQKNESFAELEAKYLELKHTMAEEEPKKPEDPKVIELRHEIDRLKQANESIEEYIRTAEENIAERERACDARDERNRALEQEIRNLRIDVVNNRNNFQRINELNQQYQEENDKLASVVHYNDERTERLIKRHEAEKQQLLAKVELSETKLENFRGDARQVVKENKEAQEALEKKDEEIKQLITKHEKAAEEIKARGGIGIRTEEQQKEMDSYIELVDSLVDQVKQIQEIQQPRFSMSPTAYRGKHAAGEGEGEGEEEERRRKLSSESSTTTTSSSEESLSFSFEEGEEELSPDLQLIHKARPRGARGYGLGPGPLPEPIIQIKETFVPGPEIRIQVPGPTVEVEVPGPIQYVDREIPVPGPIVYVDVPGADVPGPIRYTPFRVWAHNPITCWFLVEFNFLVLFFHWCKRLVNIVTWIPARILVGRAWDPFPSNEESSSSDSDSDAGVPRDPRRPYRDGPGLLSVLFNPKPGRIPSAWNTFWGLAAHVAVYATLWMYFSVAHERKLWAAENDSTRRWINHLLAQRGTNGFLGMNQMLPASVNRQLDIWRFDFMERVGIPVTYQFPG